MRPPKQKFRVLDLETTGMDATDEVVEVGITDLDFDVEEVRSIIGAPYGQLYGTLKPIPPEASAVHHITDEMVTGKPLCLKSDLRWSTSSGDPTFLVAHNADFERKWFTDDVCGGRHWICTLKAAARVWPEAASKGLSYLRYWLGIKADPEFCDPPHRAGPDTYVTAHVLGRLLERASVNEMVRWTAEPRWMPTCPLKQHKGKAWTEVPYDYLVWITEKAPEMDVDTKYWANAERDRRRAA